MSENDFSTNAENTAASNAIVFVERPGILLDGRELATVLAALRYWQRTRPQGTTNTLYGKDLSDAAPMEGEVATDGGSLKPLAANEIDSLCERLNHE
jgi:hypothetical protein